MFLFIYDYIINESAYLSSKKLKQSKVRIIK